MHKPIDAYGLTIDFELYQLIETEIRPDTGVTEEQFWRGLADIVAQYQAGNRALLAKRATLQTQLDTWHKAQAGAMDATSYRAFLQEIGYFQPCDTAVQVVTENVDPEIAQVAAPQLVVPADNARYALNAANARWNSLYDALYGSDVIAETDGCQTTATYNPKRGARVVQYVRTFLDQAVPLATSSYQHAVSYRVVAGALVVGLNLDDTEDTTELADPAAFIGYRGAPDAPDHIILCHHGLHIIIKLDAAGTIGKDDPAHVNDVTIESALTTIIDLEDSVSAVDARDKVHIYRNWAGLMRGNLCATFTKNGRTEQRTLQPNYDFTARDGRPACLPGRCLMYIRHVGSHMVTDAVTFHSEPIAETFLDAMVTTLAAMHDLRGNGDYTNSRHGSVYVVKPKMHGSEEVAAAVELFAQVEVALGLPANTIKIGIMDEERRTTLNLPECLHQARTRAIFINTGFLDRTGDEIHTCMEAGAVVTKAEMKNTDWLQAYEEANVAVGISVGLVGRGQIGKGMWAAPEAMRAMMEQKIAHPQSGANTAWVPSPSAATLHALHYHAVDVAAQQQQLARMQSHDQSTPWAKQLPALLTLPLAEPLAYDEAARQRELENNIQGILGYVVRWVEQGIGCSKVPDINDVGLMEDRATLRISSQHIANWLHHKVVSEPQVRAAFAKMAEVVDRQNADDPHYRAMAADFDGSIGFQAACELVFTARTAQNGYTEEVLHRRRREYKAQAMA